MSFIKGSNANSFDKAGFQNLETCLFVLAKKKKKKKGKGQETYYPFRCIASSIISSKEKSSSIPKNQFFFVHSLIQQRT